MGNKGQRLEEIIGFLIYKGYISIKSTQKDLSIKIDMDYSNISRAFKLQEVHLRTMIKKINLAFGDIFDENWLLTGQGEMLKPTENSSRNVHNEGSISGIVSTGDNHTSINGGLSVGNDSTSKSSDNEQRILLLENEVKYLNELLAEKERIIQVLLKNS